VQLEELNDYNNLPTAFVDRTGPFNSCCPDNTCWDGNTCVPSTSNTVINENEPDKDYVLSGNFTEGTQLGLNQYACHNDDWNYFYYKADPGGSSGYCYDNAQCWLEDDCVDAGETINNGAQTCVLQNGVGTWTLCDETTFGTILDSGNDGILDYWCLENNQTTHTYAWLTLSDLAQLQQGVFVANERITGGMGWDESEKDCRWLTSYNMLLNGDFSSGGNGWATNSVSFTGHNARFSGKNQEVSQSNITLFNLTLNTISFDVSLVNPAPDHSLRMTISFFDENNDAVSLTDPEGTCPISGNSYVSSFSTLQPAFACTFKAPLGATHGILKFKSISAGSWNHLTRFTLDNIRLEQGTIARDYDYTYESTQLCNATTNSSGCWSPYESEFDTYDELSRCCGDDGTEDDWNLFSNGTVGRCRHGVWENGDYPLLDWADRECAYVTCTEGSGSACSQNAMNENYYCQVGDIIDGGGVGESTVEELMLADFVAFCDDDDSLIRTYDVDHPIANPDTVTVWKQDFVGGNPIYLDRNLIITSANCGVNQFDADTTTITFTSFDSSDYFYMVRYTTEDDVGTPAGIIDMDGVCRQKACIQANTEASCGSYDSLTQPHECKDYVCRTPSCEYVTYSDNNRRVPVCVGDGIIIIPDSRVFSPGNLNNLTVINNCPDPENSECTNYITYMNWYEANQDSPGFYRETRMDPDQCIGSNGSVDWSTANLDEFAPIYEYEGVALGQFDEVPPTFCTDGLCICNAYAVCDNECRENEEPCEPGGDMYCGYVPDEINISQAPCCNSTLEATGIFSEYLPSSKASFYGCCADSLETCWDGFTCVDNGTTRNVTMPPDGDEWLCANTGVPNNLLEPNFEGWTFSDMFADPCEFSLIGSGVVCHHQHNSLSTYVETEGGMLTFIGNIRSTENGNTNVGIYVNNTLIHTLTVPSDSEWTQYSYSFFVSGSFTFMLRIHSLMDADQEGDSSSLYFDDFSLVPGSTEWVKCDLTTVGETYNDKTCYELFGATGSEHLWADTGTYQLKYDWYKQNSAYCQDEMSCYVSEGTGRCDVNGSYDYTEDHYCYEGNWTTRTAYVAYLLTSELNDNYVLFCDKKEQALNLFDLSDYETGFCVLDKYNGGDSVIAIGTPLPIGMTI